jgi:Uma2 family endonuclease
VDNVQVRDATMGESTPSEGGDAISAGPIAYPPPLQGWTVRDLDRLPDDGQRYELLDGVVVVAPSPTWLHQRVASDLEWLLRSVAPSSIDVGQAVGIVLAEDECPLPDIVVLRAPVDYQQNRYPAAQVVLVVEVVSPSTRSTDRFRQPGQYALAGIPFYWRVETEPVQIIAYRLRDDGQYGEYARADAGNLFIVAEPLAVEFDPAELLP